MKKLCLILMVLASNCYADGSSDGFKAVHESSAGKLISIYYSTGNLQNYVDTANDMSLDFGERSVVFIANNVCDFSKPWTGSDSTIYCIAK
jgi:hypothetical protein